MSTKIGIITMFDCHNFGNRLQNYAVQTVLENLGYKCETIVPESLYKVNPSNILKDLACSIAGSQLSYKHPDAVRYYRIRRFNRNIHFRVVKEDMFSPMLADEYDYFVTGSDQVWNPYFWNALLGNDVSFNNYFLRFARPEQRKCFSPSIGITELPGEWEEPFRNELLQFTQLNIRETAGADIIYRLTGRRADVTLDPTLLLTQDDWKKVSRKFKACPQEKYILYVMLGSEAEEISVEQKAIINNLARQHGLIGCRMIIRKRPEWFSCGPGEFIYMIQHAELVCTDSFHCVVFSILFGKPFLLFKRIIKKYGIDMSSRTETLLSLLDLERKKPENQVWDETNIFEADYAGSIKILENLKQKTLGIIKNMFM
ncbi:polysaccharide pyruvyl transferase family protein [Clostridium sp. AF18-27]|uniref:polysaccharide pyruvyl transferase family protein n=1 Tax=Enterocloster lavalensis TaxID=460384 RepID=UPI000E537E94|nr:polysaccharide pyruvyl transferase family protein [Enterocloster lavalensis]RHR51883.1 polysaccharide pyruvyl transferase family protein [Clostridium sp. AF18-27]